MAMGLCCVCVCVCGCGCADGPLQPPEGFDTDSEFDDDDMDDDGFDEDSDDLVRRQYTVWHHCMYA